MSDVVCRRRCGFMWALCVTLEEITCCPQASGSFEVCEGPWIAVCALHVCVCTSCVWVSLYVLHVCVCYMFSGLFVRVCYICVCVRVTVCASLFVCVWVCATCVWVGGWLCVRLFLCVCSKCSAMKVTPCTHVVRYICDEGYCPTQTLIFVLSKIHSKIWIKTEKNMK